MFAQYSKFYFRKAPSRRWTRAWRHNCLLGLACVRLWIFGVSNDCLDYDNSQFFESLYESIYLVRNVAGILCIRKHFGQFFVEKFVVCPVMHIHKLNVWYFMTKPQYVWWLCSAAWISLYKSRFMCVFFGDTSPT